MTSFDNLEEAQDDLDAIMIDVLGSVLGEEAAPADGPLPTGPVAAARLAIHDEVDDSFAVVEVRIGVALARVLASRMMFVADPSADDILDAVAELGNICGGNVKSLLCQHARLSLPSADIAEGRPPLDDSGVQVRAIVLGHVAELAVTPGAPLDGLAWPPHALDEELENHV
jgi:hypothetical protein